MGSTRRVSSGNNSSVSVLSKLNLFLPVIAGVLLGLAAFLIKIVMTGASFNMQFVFSFFLNPLTWSAIISGLAGFLIFQKSLYRGKVSVAYPIVSGVSIAIPVAFAFLFLGEILSTIKIVGIVLILVGVTGLRD